MLTRSATHGPWRPCQSTFTFFCPSPVFLGRFRRAYARSKSGSGSNGKDSNGSSRNGNKNSNSPPMAVFKLPSESEQGVAQMRIPDFYPNLLVLPIARKPLFPHSTKNILITDPDVCAAMKHLVDAGQPYLGTFLTKSEDNEADSVKSLDEIHRIGIFAQIMKLEPNGENSVDGLTATLHPHRRIRIQQFHLNPKRVAEDKKAVEVAAAKNVDFAAESEESSEKPSPTTLLENFAVNHALVENLTEEPYSKKNPLIRALVSEILSTIKDVVRFNPGIKDQITLFTYASGVNLVDEPALLADFAASLAHYASSQELQAIIESLVVEERLQKALILMKKEHSNAELQHQINADVEEKMAKTRKEYYLMELMKGVQKELGMENDGKEKLIQTFTERASSLVMPSDVKEVFEEELQRFKNMESSAMEFNVARNYLDWLTQLPWGKTSSENFDILNGKTILDADHFGMKDVKERILEFIAVSKLKHSVQGKILCLVGPPGVGKTSIGKSIARALNREFFRFSVGGVGDVSEIKGHRRTYVGAIPGKIVQALKKVQTENPLILMDEIDKIGKSNHRGDPSSALLEVLDPEQNSTFTDHYMDVPIDLSRVLFVCTANTLDTIPGPLLDRMEVIRLAGYDDKEKMAIADNYLIPSTRMAMGLEEGQVDISQNALKKLIDFYCRESGVRNLKKQVEKIFRKSALQLVEAQEDEKGLANVKVTAENLHKYVGNPIFMSDLMYEHPPAGVVMGLAWTSLGGQILYIESLVRSHGKRQGSFIQTGQLGDVMKESSSIAMTYAKEFLNKVAPEKVNFFHDRCIHLHVPAGATPKDGPSAGCAMVTSLASLAMNKPIRSDVVMTGEITLTGQVLKVGGIKDKILAAKRNKLSCVLIPEGNRADYNELEEHVREGMIVHFVSTYDDVYNLVFDHSKQ